MVETFDAHGVSFVSVTQQFNTTSSMGRLTLNVLLSFAQFEREVTGERIRDKIAASKRKGMWMGGTAPIGYIAKDRTLAIDDEQAERVRAVYRLYLELNCVRLLKEELARRKWVTPPRKTHRPEGGGNRPFSRGHLYRILANPVYAGKIAHRSHVFAGKHPAIVDPGLWHAVQERLTINQQGRRKRANAKNPSPLAGLLFDDAGMRLTPTHAQKKARRYRYYVSAQAVDGSGPSEYRLRLPAQELEDLVASAVISWLRNESQILGLLADRSAGAVRECLRQARALADRLETAPAEHLRGFIDRVVVRTDTITIAVRLESIGLPNDVNYPNDGLAMIEVPARRQRCGMAVRLIVRGPDGDTRRSPDAKLVALLAKAQDWLGRLTSGRGASIGAIAEEAGVGPWYVTRVMYVGLLAPDIVQRIVRGEHPPAITADSLIRMTPLPCDWTAQRALLGLG